jgi:hypothetical protein
MALDGFDKGNPEVVDQIATEAFLRGCRDKEAARSVFEKDFQKRAWLLLYLFRVSFWCTVSI